MDSSDVLGWKSPPDYNGLNYYLSYISMLVLEKRGSVCCYKCRFHSTLTQIIDNKKLKNLNVIVFQQTIFQIH